MEFNGENIIAFSEHFKDNASCLSYLVEIKWANGFTCSKCGSTHSSVRKLDNSRQCNQCHHTESPTANTLFHKVKFGIRKVFMIVFEKTSSTKSSSSSQMAKRYGITRMTAWLFMHKVREGMKSSQSAPMSDTVQVDEFVVGGRENLKQGRRRDTKKKKIVCAVGLSETQKFKRVYGLRIDDYSSKLLEPIFDQHISREAAVKTNEWRGYMPLSKEYTIEQIPSMNGAISKQMHHIIHQIKTWLNTTFSWVHTDHINRYLDEYSFRINRSISKQTILHNLIKRMVAANTVIYQIIKFSA